MVVNIKIVESYLILKGIIWCKNNSAGLSCDNLKLEKDSKLPGIVPYYSTLLIVSFNINLESNCF